MEELTVREDVQIDKLLSALTKSQIRTDAHLQNLKAEITEIEQRISAHDELFEKHIYLNSGEKREVQRHVRDKVRSILERHEYGQASRIVFPMIYNHINGQYNVTTYHELPHKYYREVIDTIDNWYPSELDKQRINKRIYKKAQ